MKTKSFLVMIGTFAGLSVFGCVTEPNKPLEQIQAKPPEQTQAKLQEQTQAKLQESTQAKLQESTQVKPTIQTPTEGKKFKVTVRGMIKNENIPFDGCPKKIVANIKTPSKMSIKASNININEGAIGLILNRHDAMESESIRGFQVKLDSNGYFYFCDEIHDDNKVIDLEYTLHSYSFLNGCKSDRISVMAGNITRATSKRHFNSNEINKKNLHKNGIVIDIGKIDIKKGDKVMESLMRTIHTTKEYNAYFGDKLCH